MCIYRKPGCEPSLAGPFSHRLALFCTSVAIPSSKEESRKPFPQVRVLLHTQYEDEDRCTVKREGRIIELGKEKLLVSVGEDTPPGQGAACCSVLSLRMEVGNPHGLEFQPGDLVEISDGLGRMILAGGGFLVLPLVLFGVGTVWSLPLGILGSALGLMGAFWIFRAQRLAQYPVISRRLGPINSDEFDEYGPKP